MLASVAGVEVPMIAFAAVAGEVAVAVAGVAVVEGAEVVQPAKLDLGGSLRRVGVRGLAAAGMWSVVPGSQIDCGCLTETARVA